MTTASPEYRTSVYDREAFLKKARELDGRVSVCRMMDAVPETQPDGRVVMRSAVRIIYGLKKGDTNWVFIESHAADEEGVVDLSGSLLDAIVQENVPYYMVMRSGSF